MKRILLIFFFLLIIIPINFVKASEDHRYHFFKQLSLDPQRKHVHMMHLDGFRADTFHALLENGQLPHFQLLLSRGKISYATATVDKTETMKVIQSYLTARRETEVVGWWQFDRDQHHFENFWIDPVGVMDFALGLRFPLYPTFFDFLASRGEKVAAGFSLHRRSVGFKNYTRNYLEGFMAVNQHTYLHQAHRTMESISRLYKRLAQENSGENFPVLTTSLLAAADEFGHLEGIVREPRDGGDPSVACIQRGESKIHDAIFEIMEDANTGPQLQKLYQKRFYFTKIRKRGNGSIQEICFQLPRLDPFYASPHYILGMMLIDMEIGNLINTLRSIRFDSHGRMSIVEGAGNGLEAYLDAGGAENSVFENTLFVFLGDHGMVDTKYMMAPPFVKDSEGHLKPVPYRHRDSLKPTFLEDLNRALNIKTVTAGENMWGVEFIGIDDTSLPLNLAMPHKLSGWQSKEILQFSNGAREWSEAFFAEIVSSVKRGFLEKFAWVRQFVPLGELFLRRLIEKKIESQVKIYREKVVDAFSRLYLKGIPEYVAAEKEMVQAFYDKHVRLVYGGGAKNNAELFLPVLRDGRWSWQSRPSFDEMMNYGSGSLMRALSKNPGVGLIFIRKQNEEIRKGGMLPNPMEILVADRSARRGIITVKQNSSTGERLYAYTVEAASSGDPLGYGSLASSERVFRTFNEWNDLSIGNRHHYHNVVAGIGGYLYSDNPAIGDMLLMHSDDWNFGDNAGGHGGVHRDEKLTLMLVSGPGIQSGELFARGPRGEKTYPTVVDAAPTILNWLGYGEGALTDFSRDGFEGYLREWVSGQKRDCLDHLDDLDGLQEALQSFGVTLRLSDFRDRFERLLQFMPDEPPPLPNFNSIREDGNQLML